MCSASGVNNINTVKLELQIETTWIPMWGFDRKSQGKLRIEKQLGQNTLPDVSITSALSTPPPPSPHSAERGASRPDKSKTNKAYY